jgi:hypothetical protein
MSVQLACSFVAGETLKHIVTCRPIARQRLGKHIPAEPNARNNRTFIARQRISKLSSLTIEAMCSVWSLPRGYKRTENTRQNIVFEWRVEFSVASLPGYELGSRGIESSRAFGIGTCRIMTRKELSPEKKTPCVI